MRLTSKNLRLSSLAVLRGEHIDIDCYAHIEFYCFRISNLFRLAPNQNRPIKKTTPAARYYRSMYFNNRSDYYAARFSVAARSGYAEVHQQWPDFDFNQSVT